MITAGVTIRVITHRRRDRISVKENLTRGQVGSETGRFSDYHNPVSHDRILLSSGRALDNQVRFKTLHTNLCTNPSILGRALSDGIDAKDVWDGVGDGVG